MRCGKEMVCMLLFVWFTALVSEEWLVCFHMVGVDKHDVVSVIHIVPFSAESDIGQGTSMRTI